MFDNQSEIYQAQQLEEEACRLTMDTKESTEREREASREVKI